MKYRQTQTLVVALTLLAFSPMLLVQDSNATTINVNTGYDHNGGVVYPIPAFDAYWKVIADPDPGTSEPRPAWTIVPHYAWAPAMGASRWISSYPDYANNTNDIYEFEFCFYLDPSFSTASLYMEIRADDSARVYLNGNWIGDANWYSWNNTTWPTPPNFSTTSYFQAGNNLITVELANTDGVAMGFNIDGTVTADVDVVPGCMPATGTIKGMKWDDGLIPNCVKDPGEPVLQGWEINLSNGDKTWTDKLGNYYFWYLEPGTYTVTETQEVGWIQECPVLHSYTEYVGPNQVIPDLDFGNIQNDTLGSIEGYKFYDYDCDGEWDSDEPGIENWDITLWQGSTPIMSTWTDASGHYIFSPLDPGDYGVSENHYVFGYEQTYPVSVSYYHIDLQMGQHLTDYNFGNSDTCDVATHWDTLTAGGIDDFQGTEPSHWGEGLSEFMNGVDHIDNFDETASDEFFGYTYEHDWGQCCIKAATLTINLCATSGGSSTDALALGHYGQGGTIWWIYMNDLIYWANGDPSWDYGDCWTFVLDLADLSSIPNGHGYDNNILAALKMGELDVLIQDDTGCDWLNWEIEVCCRDCCDIRGDINHDGTGPDIADLVYLVNYMFNGGPEPPCEDPPGSGYFPECDFNGDFALDIADLVYMVNYMFGGGPPPVPCP